MDQTNSEKAGYTLLGSFLNNKNIFTGNEHLIFDGVFHNQHQNVIYVSMLELYKSNKSIDLIILSNHIQEKGLSAQYRNSIKNLQFNFQCDENPKPYIDIVFNGWVAKTMIPKLNEYHTKLYTGESNPIELLHDLKGDINKVDLIVNNASTTKLTTDVVDEAIARILSMREKPEGLIGFSYGLKSLDNKTGGIMQGINVIAATPGAGKTTQVINVFKRNCVDNNLPALFFSVEMPAIEIVTNILANISEINSRALRQGDVDDGNVLSLKEAGKRIKNNLEIDDKGGITWQYVESKIKEFKLRNRITGPALVAIDYLQIMNNSADEKRLPKEERIETICNELTRICKDEHVHLILLSQFSREVMKRDVPRPKMSDLKGSGAIEANAVAVLLQFRPEYHGIYEDENGRDLRGLCEITIGKGRYVNPEPVYVRFIGRYSQFKDIEEQTSNPF